MDMWFDFLTAVSPSSAAYLRVPPAGSIFGRRASSTPQNDFSYNIGPGMFRDIFLPIIRRQTEFLDHSVYHVTA
jgi:hypothetical protein